MADNLVKALSQENLRQIINILMTMNKSDESTGVKVYANGEEYLKDDIVVYLQENATDYTLLICTTSHTSSTDIPDMLNFATVDSTVIENFTDEEISELFDLSEEEAVELTKLIDNVHIAINKVYSSQKTEERLTEILAEANEYATKLLGNANFLTVEIVTSESEVTSNNVLYLVDDGQGTNTYNQFILVDEEVKSLGSTSIDLSNYHTKDEITTLLADYAKKNEILSSDNIVTTIDDTVTNTQVVGALTVKEELDKKIDKNSIVTTLDDTVTDEQIPSAKTVYDNFKNRRLNTYTYLSEIGLTVPCSVSDIFLALPDKSMITIGCESKSSSITDVPADYGLLQIIKHNIGRFSIEYNLSAENSIAKNRKWIGQLKGSDGSGVKWDEIFYTTTATCNDAVVIEDYLDLLDQDANCNILFTNNGNTGEIVDLTRQNLFCIEHRKRNDAMYTQVAYHPAIGIIAQRSKNWWNGAWSPWRKIYSTSVPDEPKTYMTSLSSSYHFNNAFYSVINNVCYVTLNVKVIVSEPSHTLIFNLPKSKVPVETSIPPLGAVGNSSIHYDLSTSGTLSLLYGEVGRIYMISFSYPVATE